jgi:predicted flap endonuclease-1-like 5' DNA nuclease
MHYDEFFKEQYEKIQKKLDLISANLMYNQHFPNDPFIDNPKFMELMGISAKTALNWREQGIIEYVQINAKIYYKLSSINELLERNTRKSTK